MNIRIAKHLVSASVFLLLALLLVSPVDAQRGGKGGFGGKLSFGVKGGGGTDTGGTDTGGTGLDHLCPSSTFGTDGEEFCELVEQGEEECCHCTDPAGDTVPASSEHHNCPGSNPPPTPTPGPLPHPGPCIAAISAAGDSSGSTSTCSISGGGGGGPGGSPDCTEQAIRRVFTPDTSTDLMTMSSSGGGSGSIGGCAGCGGSSSGGGSSMPGLAFIRKSVPANQVEQFSHGRGMASNYDLRFTLYPVFGQDPVALLYDPLMQTTFYLEDTGANGDYELENNVYYKSIELTDANGNSVGDPGDAASSDVFAKITRRNGWVYNLKVCSTSMEGGEFASQLTSIVNPQGESINLTYKNFTQAQIDSSPSRQLQLDTVTDGYGNSASISYHPQQQGGLWVISQIDLNNGEAMLDYGYNFNGLLSSVSRNTEVVGSYTYGIDPDYGFATIKSNRRADYSHSRNDTVMLSPDYQNGDGTVVNQYANILQGVRNGAGQVKHMVYADPDNVGWYKILFEHQMVQYKAGESVRWYETWTQSGSGYDGITGVLESTWSHAPGITAGQIMTIQAPSIVDKTGYSVDNSYDPNGNLVRVDHADETFEKYLYDSNNMVRYYRDRAGFVEVTERDANHRVVRVARGLVDVAGTGTPTATPEAVQDIKGYYGAGHANEGRLAWSATTAYSNSVSAPPANERTDYEYDANQRLAKTKLPLPNGQAERPEMTYVWTGNYKTSQTDPEGHVTTYSYDFMGRQIGTQYSDQTSEQTLYDDVHSTIYNRNRIGVVSKRSYGPSGRMTSQVSGYGRDEDLSDGQVDTVSSADRSSVTNYVYFSGVSQPFHTTTDGSRVMRGLDYRGRQIGQIQQPSSRSIHRSFTTYVNNQKFEIQTQVEDLVSGQEYDLRNYYGYSANRLTVRTIQTRTPDVIFADNNAVLNAIRVGGEDPDYIINDALRDIRGQIVQLIDPLDVETVTTYDALGRSALTTRTGGSLSLSSQQSYDEDGNVTQQISEAGVVTEMTYDGAGNLKTRTEAPGTDIAATWTYTYDPSGRQKTVTSPLGNVTTSVYETCCGFTVGRRNALGHGSVSNANAAGQNIHSATLEDYDSHSNLLNPTDATTLSESTSKYDDLGRVQYRTRWKTPRGVIDRDNPPIAGFDGVALADGLTTQTVYFNNVGGAGAARDIELPGGGTATVSIDEAVAKLAAPIANGGAEISFARFVRGKASIAISADQKTMQVSISDAVGRGIFSGQMWGPASATPNQLINWSCTIHDQYANAPIVALKTSSVDLDGHQTHSIADGFGRTILSIDQLGNKSTRKYDAGGKVLRSINALTHETVYAYDDLGRQTSVTDALQHTRTTAYDPATGRVSSQTDAKGNPSSNVYDDRGRVTASIDRLGKSISKTYDLEGRQLTITDAENRETTYVYNQLGQRTATTLADQSARGMTYDAAGRLIRTDFASGKSMTNVYREDPNDIAGLLRKVEYRNAGATLAVNDTFTYDDLLRRKGSSSRYGVDQSMVYDDRGQLQSESTTYGGQTYTVSYDRDARGRTEKVTYPSGTYVNYDYTDRGLLDTIKVDGSEIEDRGYSDLGQLTSVDRPSIDEARSYDDRGQLTSIANGAVGTASYAYDANGNKLSESWSGAMSSWNFTTQSGGNDGYDAEDRFLNFNQSGQSKTLAMTRSDIGNISNVILDGASTARSYSNVHELEGVGSGSQSFDTDGNLTSATNGNTFDWDEGGMMKQADVSGGPTVEYGYSADGKRIWKKVGAGETVFVHSGPNCVAEYAKGATSATVGNEYVYSGGIDAMVMLVRSGGSEKLSVTRNQQWSVSALIDAGGSVVERYTYDHFGKRTILAADGSTKRASSNYDMEYGYTSRRHETETGLMHFRARYYDPGTGEFISRDPLEYVDGMSQYRGYFVPNGVDSYGTCNNRPPCGENEVLGRDRVKNFCFCSSCGTCYLETQGGRFIQEFACPHAVCPIGEGEFKHLNKPENALYNLAVTICEATADKVDPCGYCDKLFSGNRLLAKQCKDTCGDTIGDWKEWTCKKLACQGVTKGLPGGECFKSMFNKDGKRIHDDTKCINCCNNLPNATEAAKDKCRAACTYWADPSSEF